MKNQVAFIFSFLVLFSNGILGQNSQTNSLSANQKNIKIENFAIQFYDSSNFLIDTSGVPIKEAIGSFTTSIPNIDSIEVSFISNETIIGSHSLAAGTNSTQVVRLKGKGPYWVYQFEVVNFPQPPFKAELFIRSSNSWKKASYYEIKY